MKYDNNINQQFLLVYYYFKYMSYKSLKIMMVRSQNLK